MRILLMRQLSWKWGNITIYFDDLFLITHFSYEKSKGRHVIARKNIQKGDVLFVEKALIFAPVFKENKELYPFKCYNCLKDTLSCIP